MTNDRLREIWERRQAATPGPWRVSGDWIVQTSHITRDVWYIPRNTEDLNFIANAPADIDYLLGEIARLTSTVEIMRKNMVTLQAETDQNLRDLGPNGSQ